MQTVLLVTAVPAGESCAADIGRELNLTVEVAPSRRVALAALRRSDYAVVVLDEGLAESDSAATDMLWQLCGLAIPLQVNLGITGCNRVLREVRAALHRREREQSLAIRAAARVLAGEMSTALTGLLLQAQLALAEPDLPPGAAAKLESVLASANSLRARLSQDPP